MKIILLAVGKIKEPAMRTMIDEYYSRIRRYVSCEEFECVDDSASKTESFFSKHASNSIRIAMDIRGKSMHSTEFAKQVERLGSQGKGMICFLLGGADGLSKDVLESCQDRWSLSQLTMPHRLARLVLAEQLYRSMSILRGEPYAHESSN